MRILRLNSMSGPAGGVENYINDTDRILSKLGHIIKTITLSTDNILSTDTKNVTITMSSGPISRVFHDFLPSEELLKMLNLEFKKFGPDLIHLHHFRIGFETVYKFLVSLKTPIIFTAHDALPVCPLDTLVKPGNIICEGGISLRCGFTGCKIHSHLPYEIILSRSFKSLSKSKIKVLICPSYSIMNYLISNGFSPAVHLPSFSYFDPELEISEPDYNEILLRKNIGFIGRLEKYKGVDDLINGFAIFSKTHPDFNLLIAGSGTFEGDLRKLTTRLKLENKVKFLGSIGNEQREEFYKNILCNVIPTKFFENLVLSAQESLIRGVPTIGTRMGGIPEIIIDGVTGFTIDISSPSQIAEMLDKVLQNRNNQVLKIMREGRSFVLNNLTPEKHVKGLLDIYQKVLNGVQFTNGFDENKLK